MKRLILTGIVVVVALVLVACSAKAPVPPTPGAGAARATAAIPGSQEADWQKVVAEARKEGAVNFYSTFGSPDLRTSVGQPLKDKYGVEVNWMVGPGTVNTERVRVEQQSKQVVADVLWTGFSPAQTTGLRAVDALLPFTPPIVLQEPNVWERGGIRSVTDKQDVFSVVETSGGLPMVNTTLVRREEYPRSYKDLLDPKWRGRMTMQDPAAVHSSGSILFSILQKEYGLEYWEKMGKQDIFFYRDGGEVVRRVAIGETPLALGVSEGTMTPFIASGAPVRLLPVPEGGFKLAITMFLINRSPHPNAAKVFINWAVTREGQEILSRHTGYGPIRKDAEYKLDPAMGDAVRATPKWVMGTFEVGEEWDRNFQSGTARKVLGLK